VTVASGVVDWASKKIEEALRMLGSDAEKGLTSEEAKARLQKYGENVLVEEERESFWDALKEEAREPMILLLITVGILYSILGTQGGSILDAITIFTVITVLVTVEVYNEYKAEQGIESLKKLTSPTSLVVRDGKVNEVPSTEVVPGDIFLLSVGERISTSLLSRANRVLS
jgi:Ca2+-transporting ATPase